MARALFVVTSLVHLPAGVGSIYAPEQRQAQMLRTLLSVRAHAAPQFATCAVVVVEASRPGAPEVPDFELDAAPLRGGGALSVATLRLPEADRAEIAALPKSAGEATLLLAYLRSADFAARAAEADVVFKLSGRYELTPAFDAKPFVAASALGLPAARNVVVLGDDVTVTILFSFPPAGPGMALMRERLEAVACVCARRGAPDIEHVIFAGCAPGAQVERVEPCLGVRGRHAPSGLLVEY